MTFANHHVGLWPPEAGSKQATSPMKKPPGYEPGGQVKRTLMAAG